jgi:zinc protease
MRRLRFLAFLAALPWLWANAGEAATRIQEVRSPAGITAWLAEDHEVKSFALHFIFRGSGRRLDRETRIGTGSLLAQVLTAPLDEFEGKPLRELLGVQSIELEFSAEWQDFVGTMRSVTSSRGEAFRLLGRLLAARKPEIEDGHRKRVKSDENGMFEPIYIATQMWARLAQSPEARVPAIGVAEDVFAVTPADLERAMELGFVRDRLIVAVVGDVTAAELGPLLDQAFGALPRKSSSDGNDVHRAPITTPSGIAVVERALPQSFVIWSQTDPAFPPEMQAAARMLREIIGGQGSSRLYAGLRDARGLAYFVQMVSEPGSGLPWMGIAATRNEAAGTAIDVIKAEWRRLAQAGVTDREIALARQELRDQNLLSLTSFAEYARQLVHEQSAGFKTAGVGLQQLEAVTKEDVLRAARRLDAEQLLFVIVGQPQGVTPTIPLLEPTSPLPSDNGPAVHRNP